MQGTSMPAILYLTRTVRERNNKQKKSCNACYCIAGLFHVIYGGELKITLSERL